MRFSRSAIQRAILLALTVTTVITLAANIPDGALIAQHLDLFVIYSLLTAFALYFGVTLSQGELGSAHVVGMVALLSLARGDHPAMLWAVALGGVVGGIMLVIRASETLPHRPLTARSAQSIIAITARVTLSFFVASQFYVLIGGRLPVQRLTPDEIAPLTAFSIVYVGLYLAIFLLETYLDGRRVGRLLKTDLTELLIALTLPIPFALLGAEVYSARLSLASFAFLIAGLTLTMFGQYSISRAQYRLSSQLNELRAISTMSQAMSASLDLDSLLGTLYEQVSARLAVDNFVVALYERGGKRLTYPFAVQNGKPVSRKLAADGLLHHVLKTESPLLVSDGVADAARQFDAPMPSGVASWVGVPLASGGRLLGAIAAASHDPVRRFGADDLRLLNVVAANASVAIDNAQLYAQQSERARQMATLNTVVSRLTGTLSPETVLDTVMSSALMLANARAVAVYLFWDDPNSTLALVRSSGLSEQFAAEPPDPLLLSRHRAQPYDLPPVIVEDSQEDSRAAALRGMTTREGIRAWVELPLLVGGFGLGVLVLLFEEPRTFTDEQIELYRTFASQAAQAVRNARTYAVTDETLERRVGQLLALASIGHELTATLDIETICQLVLSHALDATAATVGVVIYTEASTNAPHVIADRGYPSGTFANPALLVNGISGRAFADGQTILAPDVSAHPDYMALCPSTRSQLSVPIQRGASTLGIITLESDRLSAFNEEDSQFVTQLANQAVIAIDNAHLFRRIAEARDRLQVILDTMTEAIVLLDLRGSIRLANPRVSLIGLRASQLLHQDVEALLEDPDLDFAEKLGFRSDQDVRKLLKEARVAGWQGRDPSVYSLDLDGGTVYIQRRIIPVHSGESELLGLLLVFYDQTEEQRLKQTRENLSNMIVHDLRSPLTAVVTSLKLLDAVVPQDDSIRPLVLTTTDAGQRAIRKILTRVDSLLDVARMESGHLTPDAEPVALRTLAANAMGELEPLAQELGVTLETHVPDDLPSLWVDGDKVERLLLNVIDNALKFSPANTFVALRAHAPGMDGAAESFVRVDVVDNGPGVPDEYKTRLFDRFVQAETRGHRRGTGLGLTFCKLVVESHGGRIWIEDNPAGGSIFAFTLPLVREAVEERE